jgi:hypothetical protein
MYRLYANKNAQLVIYSLPHNPFNIDMQQQNFNILANSNVSPIHIAQITGHRNIFLFNNYSHINNDLHRDISQILHQNTCEHVITQISEDYARSSSIRETNFAVNQYTRLMFQELLTRYLVLLSTEEHLTKESE